MRSEQYWPGDKVMTLVNHHRIPRGTVGRIDTRWMGSIYAVRSQNGEFYWLFSNEVASINPNRHRITEGDSVRIISNKREHEGIEEGDLVQVLKIIDSADYYGVILNNELHWLTGFELARYM